jgi:glutamate--cysteine ligase
MEKHNTHYLQFHRRTDFDFQNVNLNTCIIIDEALKRNLEAEFVLKYLEIRKGSRRALFHISDSTSLSKIANKIAASKWETKVFLQRAGVKVARGKRFLSSCVSEIQNYVSSWGSAVVKPEYGSEGRGVMCDVTPDQVESILSRFDGNSSVVVEEMVPGEFYRFTTTIDGFVAVTKKRPASVLGDGEKTISTLLDEKNQTRQPKNQFPRFSPFYHIEVDEIVALHLGSKGMDLNYIPEPGERVYLRRNANTSTGGDSIAIPPMEVHPSFKQIALQSLQAIPGMAYAGVDIMAEDVTKPAEEYAVLELNNMPGLVSPTFPYIGPTQNPAGALLDLVFP